MNTKIKTYSILFSLVILVDFFLYIFGRMNEAVNWDSPIHSGWVVFSATTLLLFAFLRVKWIGMFGLTFHFVVVISSFLNQFVSFSETLNYTCTIFNLVLFTAYYFSVDLKT